MRRLAALVCLAAVLAAPAAGLAQATLAVPIDTSVRVGFAGKARDIVVGNPMIADVTVLDSGGAIILGKEYGLTTVTAFDAFGRTVFSRQVVVMSGDENRVAYFRGAERNNFVCANTCERTPMPGEPREPTDRDSSSYTGYAGRQSTAAQAAAKSSAP